MPGCEIIKHVEDQKSNGCKHLDEKALWQGVAGVARRRAIDEIVGDNQVGQQD